MDNASQTLDRLFGARFSCRAFLPENISDATILDIVQTAGKAPSWCNAQPWNTIVTKGTQTTEFRDLINGLHEKGQQPNPDFEWPTGYSGPYQERRRAVGWQLYEAVGVQKGDRVGAARQSARNFVMFDAPHVAILHCPSELGSYGAIDCGGFVTAFCLAAQARGIATIAQAAVTAFCPDIRTYFDLPDSQRVVCAISFGYADNDHPANSFRASRAPAHEICDIRG